mgnify:CR=1 FL=1
MEINKPISSLIIFIIILLLAFLFVLPKYRELSQLSDTLTKKQAEYNGKSLFYKSISNAIESLENKKESILKINSALPADASIASLVNFVDKKSFENGLILKAVSTSQVLGVQAAKQGSSPSNQPQSKEQTIKDINLTLDLSETYQGLKNFLYSLEKSARLFEVNNISFASVGPSGAAQNKSKDYLGIYNFKIEMKTHTY